MLRIARRGAWGYAPENTLAAFYKSVQIPCDVVEFDVHRTHDGHVVVMHDHTLQRTCDNIGNVHQINLRDLRHFHEKNGEHVPLLEDVIEILKSKRKMMIDIKDKEMEHDVLGIVRKLGVHKDVIIDSDHTEVIEIMRSLDEHITLFLGGIKHATLEEINDVKSRAKTLRAKMIKIKNSNVTPAIVDDMHQQGLGLYVWGAEEISDIQDMVDLGVDAIVCKFPDRIPLAPKPDTPVLS